MIKKHISQQPRLYNEQLTINICGKENHPLKTNKSDFFYTDLSSDNVRLLTLVSGSGLEILLIQFLSNLPWNAIEIVGLLKGFNFRCFLRKLMSFFQKKLENFQNFVANLL